MCVVRFCLLRDRSCQAIIAHFLVLAFYSMVLIMTDSQDTMAVKGGMVIVDKWKGEWNQPLQVVARDFPKEAHFRVVNDAPKRLPFRRPASLVNTPATTEIERDRAVEYTLDLPDLEWLRIFNAHMPSLNMSPSDLECVMDRLEKDSYYFVSVRAGLAPLLLDR